VSSQIQTHDVVEATHWLKLRAGDRKSADTATVTGGLDLAGRAGNRGNLIGLSLESISFFKNQPV
jgi:hypothetical protein